MRNLENFKTHLSLDLLSADITATRVEVTENEVIVDVDAIDSDDNFDDNIKGIAVTWLLDIVKLPRPKHYEKQTYIFYNKVS